MIEPASGNLLEANVEALVNTVNTVGIMGKGIALQFRQAFPNNYTTYRKACEHGSMRLGVMLVVHTGKLANPQWIINFPTKKDWRSKSQLGDIAAGLTDLVECIRREKISSIAIPPLGCGNGGLDWKDVRPLIEEALSALPEVRVLLYAPEGAPAVETMRVATKTPKMTLVRAALLEIFQRYALPGYHLSMLEIQKLTYFLQAAGEPLKFDFVKQQYGPYTETLHHALQHMEGHYLRGYGDRSSQASIVTLPDAVREAQLFLFDRPDTEAHIERVTRLIEGFENPHGMELLATVHWLAQENLFVGSDLDTAVAGVHAWNERKRLAFPPAHIKAAWQRLRDEDWI